jgi:release factor glutamine methyltransferase
MTGNEALRLAILSLRAADVENAPRDARVLLAHAMGLAADRLTLHLPETLTEPQERAYERALDARIARQPVSQIIGQRQFWGMTFRVTKDTLDPRPDTETLVAEALKVPFSSMLDLGTGTGCILLSCLQHMQEARGLGVDISAAALDVARFNAQLHALDSRALFRASNWLSDVKGQFDLIVSNPPYIAADEMTDLAPEVRDWEPHLALTPGGDGLDAYRSIAQQAPARLLPGGRLMVEIGPTQGPAVQALFAAQGLTNITIRPDMDGRDRVVSAEKPA